MQLSEVINWPTPATISAEWTVPPKVYVVGSRREIVAKTLEKFTNGKGDISVREKEEMDKLDKYDMPDIIILAVDARRDLLEYDFYFFQWYGGRARVNIIIVADLPVKSARYTHEKYAAAIRKRTGYVVMIINSADCHDINNIGPELTMMRNHIVRRFIRGRNTISVDGKELIAMAAEFTPALTLDEWRSLWASMRKMKCIVDAPSYLTILPGPERVQTVDDFTILRLPLHVRMDAILNKKDRYLWFTRFETVLHADHLTVDQFLQLYVRISIGDFYPPRGADVINRVKRGWLIPAASEEAQQWPSVTIYLLSLSRWRPLVLAYYMDRAALTQHYGIFAELLSDDKATVSQQMVSAVFDYLTFVDIPCPVPLRSDPNAETVRAPIWRVLRAMHDIRKSAKTTV